MDRFTRMNCFCCGHDRHPDQESLSVQALVVFAEVLVEFLQTTVRVTWYGLLEYIGHATLLSFSLCVRDVRMLAVASCFLQGAIWPRFQIVSD